MKMKTKKQKMLIILSVVVAVVLMGMGWLYYQLHNGISLKPSKEYKVNESAVIYRQDDALWAEDLLGASKYTMGSSGCLVSCIAAAVTMNGENIEPGELNKLFSDNHIYDAEGNIQWDNINKLEGYGAEVFTDVSNDYIENCLEAGNYPIVCVRIQGLGNLHYVLIIGAEDGEYICMDPLKDKYSKLSDYGNRVYAIRCVWYEIAEENMEMKVKAESANASLSEGEEKTAVLPEKNRQLYEAFLNMEYADCDYIYAYLDSDNDGIQEMYLKKNEEDILSGYIIKYVNEGLQCIYQKEIKDAYLKGLTWSATKDTDGVVEPEMMHNGIYVYVSQNDHGEENFWYLDEAAFISAFGVVDAEPFYEYYNPDGTKRLTLYYNEETEEGCGIRYYERDPSTFETSGMYGFTFTGMSEEQWDGSQREYLKQESVDGNNGASMINEYQENYEYDSAGRITHFDSTGIIDWLSDDETKNILWIDYEYDENGNLKHRSYYHNPYVFGTWYSAWESYFDEFGRVEYEDVYITHGSLDYYYIYSDNSDQPAYELMLDNNLGSWIPEFMRLQK